jgi:pimeloyl-ACP methyl ester carboxylesterase
LWGEQDGHFAFAHGRRLAQAVPAAKLEVVPQAEHWMHWHAAESIAERISAFLSFTPQVK